MWNSIKVWMARLVRSWTIWWNSLWITILPFLPYLADHIIELKPYMTATTFMWVAGIITVVNMGLRFKTDRSLRDK